MTDPTARLLRDAENYLSALHGSVARHDNLAANFGCAGCELRDQIAAALPTLAVLPEPTDRAAALTDTERQFLSYVLALAEEQLSARGDRFSSRDAAALKTLRRMAAGAQPKAGS